MSDRFRELSSFVAVVETGAFNAAAARLGVSPPAATRHVAALEARLGVKLLLRTTRKVAPTEAGARFYEEAAAALALLGAAEAAAAGAQETPQGALRVTAPTLFGALHVAPLLRDLIDAHPALTAEALFVDRHVDLIEEGIDVAIRIGPLADSRLIARRLGAVRRVVVAAPAYLTAHGAPERPEELAAHRLIATVGHSGERDWRFVGAAGETRVKIAPALTVNSIQPALDAALAGWGVARLFSYQVADALADGRLVEILADAETRAAPIHALHAEGRRASAKIRVFVDAALVRFRTLDAAT